MYKVTEQYLKDKTQEFELESVFILSLKNEGIFETGSVNRCINLINLDLSYNKLSSVMGLRCLVSLENLDVSCNRLSALSGMEHLLALNTLNVSGNFLNSVDCLLPLTKLEKLKMLVLKDEDKNLTNPLYDSNNDAEECIMEMLPSVHVLNGEAIVGEGREFKMLCTQLENITSCRCNTQHINDWKAASIEETSFVRIGFERNSEFEKTHDIALICEKNSIQAHALLDDIKSKSFSEF